MENAQVVRFFDPAEKNWPPRPRLTFLALDTVAMPVVKMLGDHFCQADAEETEVRKI